MSGQKDSAYYHHLRTDILAMLPERVGRVLSVGCGAGVTEGALIKDRGATVVGIEMDPASAAEARQRGLEVLEGDVDAVSSQLEGRQFDCLLYADVLEHLREPERVLAAHVPHLAPGGLIIISVPNFRHYWVLWALFVQGEAPLRDAGIFDRTHVQLTTSKRVRTWMRGVGASVADVAHPMSRRRIRLLSRVTLGLFDEFLAKQVIVVSRLDGAGHADGS